MADNYGLQDNAGDTVKNAATDEVSYSGDTADVQLVRIVGVTGAEGAKSVSEYIVAHDSVDSGPSIKVGGRSVSSLTGVTLVAAADRTDMLLDLDGAQFVRSNCALGDVLSERVTNTDGASTACAGAFAATTGQRAYVTTICLHNSSNTNGFVDIRDGSAGSVLMTLPLPAQGGAVVNLPTPLRFSSNTAVAYDVSAALSTVYLTFVGFKSKA